MAEARKAVSRTFGRLVRTMVDVATGSMAEVDISIWRKYGVAEARPDYFRDVCVVVLKNIRGRIT